MMDKTLLFFCAQAVLIQVAFSQIPLAPVDGTCLGPYGNGLPYEGLPIDGLAYDGRARAYGDGLITDAWPARGLPCAPLDITPTAGGLLPVTSSSPVPPTGISIISENAFEGLIAVAGEVPFIGTTGMEGALSTGGAGAINYGCGNGVTAMVSDAVGPAFAAPAVVAPAIIAPAIPPGLGASCARGYVV